MNKKVSLSEQIRLKLINKNYEYQINNANDIVMVIDHWPTPKEAEQLNKELSEGKWSHWGVFIMEGVVSLYLGVSLNCIHGGDKLPHLHFEKMLNLIGYY